MFVVNSTAHCLLVSVTATLALIPRRTSCHAHFRSEMKILTFTQRRADALNVIVDLRYTNLVIHVYSSKVCWWYTLPIITSILYNWVHVARKAQKKYFLQHMHDFSRYFSYLWSGAETLLFTEAGVKVTNVILLFSR